MLKLIQEDWGRFDLALEGDEEQDAVATLIHAALFTDAEVPAPSDRVDDAYDRRGWWADPKAGSGLWHVRRQPLNDDARREALEEAREALRQRASALTDVAVSEIPSPMEEAGNVSRLFLRVTGAHNGRRFVVKVSL